MSPAARPRIAAVVLNYNYARFLPDALDSVLCQRTPFAEVVAVNDGSTDDSLSVLERYRDRVTVLDIPNGGQLGAALAGMAATTAEYLYFLDADDYAHPDLVKTLAPRLQRQAVKIQFQLRGVSPLIAELESVFPSFPRDYDSARMREDNQSIGFYICPPSSGNVYRRDVLETIPLAQSDHRDFIDGPATLAMPYLGEIDSVSVPLAFYRMHGENHSQWSEPTSRLLQHEVDWFRRRWIETVRLLGADAPVVPSEPLYLRERELMIAVLEQVRWPAGEVARFLRALLPTHLPARHKGLLASWAVALLVPYPSGRSTLVRARRSPLNRSSSLRRIVGVLLRGRRRQSAAPG